MRRVFMIVGIQFLFCTAACDAKRGASGPLASAENGASSAEVTVPKPRTATITKSPPKVGDEETQRKTKEEKTTVAFKGRKGGIDVDSVEVSTVEKTEECLEVQNEICTKLKVNYRKDTTDKTVTTRLVTLDGAPDPKDKPKPPKVTSRSGANQGNVYIVTRSAKGATIARADGKKPSKSEVDAIQGAYRDDGTRGKQLVASLPTQVTVGDSLDAFAEILAKPSDKDEEQPVVTSRVTVKDIRDAQGKVIVVLAIRTEVEGKSKRVDNMKLVTEGTMELRAEGALLIKAEHTGNLNATLPKKGGTLSGTTKEKLETEVGP
jgi:hypothetical protein